MLHTCRHIPCIFFLEFAGIGNIKLNTEIKFIWRTCEEKTTQITAKVSLEHSKMEVLLSVR